MRVRGRGFFALWLVVWGSATSFLLALQMEIRVPLSLYLARYLSLLHCILSRANCSWAFCSVSCTVESGSVAKYFFGISSRLGWGRNIRAVMSDHEASAKASAHLAVIAKPTRVTCRDLPARSKLNDLVRLRGAIITSCTSGATTESQ